MKQNKKMSGAAKVGVGVGLAAAAAAAAAGAYFLYGKNGARNRQKVKGWMLKAKGEVLQKMEAMDRISEQKYREVVDSVMKGYKGVKNATPAELAAAAAELKSHWSSIQKSLTGAAGKKGAAKPRRTAKGKTAKSKKA